MQFAKVRECKEVLMSAEEGKNVYCCIGSFSDDQSGDTKMRECLSCEFDMDTACVELRFAGGSMISIDCIAAEDEVAYNMY